MILDLLDTAIENKIRDNSYLIYSEAEKELNALLNIPKETKLARFCSNYHRLAYDYLFYKSIETKLRSVRHSDNDRYEKIHNRYEEIKSMYNEYKITDEAKHILRYGCLNKYCRIGSDSKYPDNVAFDAIFKGFRGNSLKKCY